MTLEHPAVAVPFETTGEAFAVARERLSPEVWDFLDGGAGDEATLRENRAEFEAWRFRQRVMSGLPSPSTATSFLGMPLSMPVLTAPFGADGLFDPEGQRAVVRADRAEGVVGIVPEAGTYSLEQVAAAAPEAARIAQLHPMGDRRNFRTMLRRIEDAGYRAICLTVDCPTGGWRERNLRNRFDIDPRVVGGNYPGRGSSDLSDVFGQLFDRNEAGVWSWGELSDAMSDTQLPWIAKGILTAEDAVAATSAGASALVVSNHGGRQLDGAPASLAQLPEVRGAVGPETEILLDSGIRRGADVVKAVALGATAVIIGRLAAAALAAGGEAGVRRVLRLLREEQTTVLTLLGRGSITDLGADAVMRAQR
ncbi:alpha-hydroxy acid oxidase [Gryllotalpicola koreensis]|uniref:Alpha-hydroxy acid oxidase n=1 Tax=Gryllotalpicola koreensis TaxID=993086 RepID=A0ABP8ACG3_9MICO